MQMGTANNGDEDIEAEEVDDDVEHWLWGFKIKTLIVTGEWREREEDVAGRRAAGKMCWGHDDMISGGCSRVEFLRM